MKKFNMHKCASPAPIVKGDRYGEFQCPKNQYEIDQMKTVPYASAMGSLQYAQVCTRPDIAYVTGLLGRFQSNPGSEHWKLIKKVLRYLQGTKGLMLTYRKIESLRIVGYSDSDYAGDDKIHVWVCVHPRRGSNIVEKFQTNRHYIVHNVCRVCCVL
jgi:hypothetical protein